MSELEKLFADTRSKTLKILKFSKDDEERGLEIHKKSIVCDSLLSPPFIVPYSDRMTQRAKEMADAGINSREISNEINNMRAVDTVDDPKTRKEYTEVWRRAGVTCASKTVAVHHTLKDAIWRLSRSKQKIDGLRDIELLATCAADIKRAKKEGKHAYIWNFQNTVPLGGGVDVDRELNNIDLIYGLGVRVMQLTYNLRNFVGDGCTERYESGLSYFGVRVVERMNKLGMLVDTGHCGYQTTLDAVAASNVPIAATHTTCKSIKLHDRGKTDEEMKAIAEKGGYIGICQIPAFVGDTGTIKEFLDHIDYAVELVGADPVGIGTDTWYRSHEPQSLIKLRKLERAKPPSNLGFWSGWRKGEPRASVELGPKMKPDEIDRGSLAWVNWPYFTVGLVTRGYSDKEIQGIIGGNFLNLLEKIIG